MTTWRKSSHSDGTQQGGCVEVAALDRAIAVRDSKDPDGPRLRFDTPAWSTFLHTIKSTLR
jgi:Domain of unknown function (DUF397)